MEVCVSATDNIIGFPETIEASCKLHVLEMYQGICAMLKNSQWSHIVMDISNGTKLLVD